MGKKKKKETERFKHLRKSHRSWSRAKTSPSPPSSPFPTTPPAGLTISHTADMVSLTKILMYLKKKKIDFDVLRLRETSNFNQFFKIANFIHPRNSHTNRRADWNLNGGWLVSCRHQAGYFHMQVCNCVPAWQQEEAISGRHSKALRIQAAKMRSNNMKW